MNRYHRASSALTLLVLLTAASRPHLSSPKPLTAFETVENPPKNDPLSRMTLSGSMGKRDEEEPGELFKDVDPKKLAAVLLEALNRSQVARRWEGDDGRDGGIKAERGEDKKEEPGTVEGVHQDGDGRLELELLKAAQGKNQEMREDEERKRVQEEEEKMTEKVTSHTTTQIIQSRRVQQPASLDGKGDDGRGTDPKRGSNSPDPGSGEKEEQLSPEELKCLETVMEEFPHLDIKRDSEQVEQKSRDYRRYTDIVPAKTANDLAMSKKKLKWQEETQKGMNFPAFRGGNFIDESEDGSFGNNVAETRPPAEQEVEDEPEEEQESDEVLSPEEEEARAKVEQEEMRRQAAEAQRAKMEEEKLADIASDMLLRYMVKQSNGNRKYSWSLSNAAEDKRSDEDQRATEEEDIDPQTIDKLIEISSRLHLPADDVVDIINDAERKKKKDVTPEATSRWQQPLSALSSSFPSASLVSAKQNNFPVSNQLPPSVNLLKTWFQEKTPRKTDTLWGKPGKPLLANWQKTLKPLSVQQDRWFTSPKSVWTGHPFYPYTFPSFYQRKPHPYYDPIYFPPPRRVRPRYNTWEPALRLNNFLGNSVDDAYTFLPKRRYHGWVQPQLRKPPAGLQQKSYYSSYPLPRYPQLLTRRLQMVN